MEKISSFMDNDDDDDDDDNDNDCYDDLLQCYDDDNDDILSML